MKITILLIACGMALVVFSGLALAATPGFGFQNSLQDAVYDLSRGAQLTGSIWVKNVDEVEQRSITLTPSIYGRLGNVGVFASQLINLAYGQEQNVNYTITVPVNTCLGLYETFVSVSLSDYTGKNQVAGGVGSVFSAAIGGILKINVVDGLQCGSVRRVFYDYDGDGVYTSGSGDEIIAYGTAKFYDQNDNLLVATNLSETGGTYFLPTSNPQAASNYYLVLDLSKLDGAALDKGWKGNLFVNKSGTYASPANTFRLNNISNFDGLNQDVDVRSRNIDRTGTFGSGLSIGPDDKDQIISPTRWNQLVAGTNFKYADLDQDGRIDPDDKDHLISPLYWNFPN